MMNCQQFQTHLEQLVESKRVDDTLLRAHLVHCENPVCRELWEQHVLLTHAIAEWRNWSPASTVSLTDAVVSEFLANAARSIPNGGAHCDEVEVLAESRLTTQDVDTTSRHEPLGARDGQLYTTSQRQGRALWQAYSGAVSVALAAAVALLLVVGIYRSFIGSEPTTQVAEVPPALVPVDPSQQNELAIADASASNEQELRKLGEKYTTLMQGATAKVTDTVAAVIPRMDQMMPEKMGTAAWLDIWSERLEPLESKLDQTLKTFVDETMSAMDEQTS